MRICKYIPINDRMDLEQKLHNKGTGPNWLLITLGLLSCIVFFFFFLTFIGCKSNSIVKALACYCCSSREL